MPYKSMNEPGTEQEKKTKRNRWDPGGRNEKNP